MGEPQLLSAYAGHWTGDGTGVTVIVPPAGTGAGEVAQNITGVAEAARLTSEGVNQAQQATTELTRMSSELASVVSQFRY